MNTTKLAVATAFAVFCAGQVLAAPFVNGSFEDVAGFVNNTNQGTMSLPDGSTAMTGWTARAGTFDPNEDIAWIGPANPFGPGGVPLTASDGSYFLDLSGYSSGAPFGGVSQAFDTIYGHRYNVSFDLGSWDASGLPVTISVFFGREFRRGLEFSNSSAGPEPIWETQNFNVTARRARNTLSFFGRAGRDFIGLDNVSVTDLGVVPEPATWTMMIIGFGAAGSMIRRRKAVLA